MSYFKLHMLKFLKKNLKPVLKLSAQSHAGLLLYIFSFSTVKLALSLYLLTLVWVLTVGIQQKKMLFKLICSPSRAFYLQGKVVDNSLNEIDKGIKINHLLCGSVQFKLKQVLRKIRRIVLSNVPNY